MNEDKQREAAAGKDSTNAERLAYQILWGQLLLLLRGKKRQGEIADAVGMSQSMVSRIERGEASVSLFDAKKLEAALCPPAPLFELVELAWERMNRTARILIQDPDLWAAALRIDREALCGLARFAAAAVVIERTQGPLQQSEPQPES